MNMLKFAKPVVRSLGSLGVYWPLLDHCANRILDASPYDAGDARPALLALAPQRFRLDLDILRENKNYRILEMPRPVQNRLISLFYGNDKPQFAQRELGYKGTEAEYETRRRFDTFMAAFLAKLYERLNVRLVITPAIYYWQEMEIGRVSQRTGRPYVVMHRENLVTAQAQRDGARELMGKLGRFEGSRIIFHNEAIRQCCIDSGFADAHQVKALGSLRMDSYIGRVRSGTANETGKKRATLFSFVQSVGMFKGRTQFESNGLTSGFIDLFKQVHGEFASLAAKNPDVEFVIKPKFLGRWLDAIDEALASHGLRRDEIPNLIVSDELNVHDLIINSDVVTGFGSTTLLESAIAAKPVIVPMFAEAALPENARYVQMHDELEELFDVARSTGEFKDLIIDRLNGRRIDEECMARRWQAFDTWVSPTDGKTLERYMKAFDEAIAEMAAPETADTRVADTVSAGSMAR
jgi:hypothetical protein